MGKVQINGSATIINTKELATEVKNKMLEAPDGYHIELQVNTPLHGKLYISPAGSLTCRLTLKAKNYELVAVPDKAKKSEVTQEEIDALANSLLSQ